MCTDSPDRRLNAYREDLADARLKGIVSAGYYTEGRPMRVVAGKTALHRGPDREQPVDTELLFGDVVDLYAIKSEWAWVQNRRDRYVGYLPLEGLSQELPEATHKVTALAAHAYERPDIKTPQPDRLYMGARLAIEAEEGDFFRLTDGRYIHQRHASPADEVAGDYVSVAERFTGVPYLWGGCTADGIDCSGLVQASMQMAGLDCPRDSDMQQGIEGEDIDVGGMEDPRRGDLVFWPGHVGIMLDETMLLHANAHHMQVAMEPLHVALYRIASGGTDVTGVRRPARLSAGG